MTPQSFCRHSRGEWAESVKLVDSADDPYDTTRFYASKSAPLVKSQKQNQY